MKENKMRFCIEIDTLNIFVEINVAILFYLWYNERYDI